MGEPSKNDCTGADNRGLHQKYEVRRTDGSDRPPSTRSPAGKHYGCEYFVLDLTHDPHARTALLAYADACEADRPELASDIREAYARPS